MDLSSMFLHLNIADVEGECRLGEGTLVPSRENKKRSVTKTKIKIMLHGKISIIFSSHLPSDSIRLLTNVFFILKISGHVVNFICSTSFKVHTQASDIQIHQGLDKYPVLILPNQVVGVCSFLVDHDNQNSLAFSIVLGILMSKKKLYSSLKNSKKSSILKFSWNVVWILNTMQKIHLLEG